MSGAHYQINQAANTVPAGTQDVARVDLYQSQVIHFVGDSSAGQASPAWTITAWPPGASHTQPTNATTFDATYTPSTPGSYKAEFLVGDGTGANKITFIFAVTRDSGGRIIDDGIREPAFGELVGDDNSGSNTRGYAQAYEALLPHGTPGIAGVSVLRTRVAYRHKKIRLLYHTILGDGGGGEFYWDATSTEADNGGTIIAPTGLATGRWKRQRTDRHVVNVRHFGALGDGEYFTNAAGTATVSSITITGRAYTSADNGKIIYLDAAGTAGGTFVSTITGGAGSVFNTADPVVGTVSGKRAGIGADLYSALTSAFSYAAANGYAVYAPRGNYFYGTTLTVANASGFRLFGEGAGGGDQTTSGGSAYVPVTEFRFTGSGSALFFDGSATVDVFDFAAKVEHLSVVGTSRCTNAIRCRSQHHSVFDSVRVGDFTDSGWYWEFGVINRIENPVCSRIQQTPLAGCTLNYAIYGTRRNSGEEFTSCTIINPCFEGTAIHAIHHEYGNNVTVIGGSIESNFGSGIYTSGTTQGDTFGPSIDLEGNTGGYDLDIAGFSHLVLNVQCQSIKSFTVLTATNATPIVVETDTPHGLSTGDACYITGALGNTAANGEWIAGTIVDATHFQLKTYAGANSVGNGAYTANSATMQSGIVGGVRFRNGAYFSGVKGGYFRNIMIEGGSPGALDITLDDAIYIATYRNLGTATVLRKLYKSNSLSYADTCPRGLTVTNGATCDTVTATTKVSTPILDSGSATPLTLKCNGVAICDVYAGGLNPHQPNVLFDGAAGALSIGQLPAAAGNHGVDYADFAQDGTETSPGVGDKNGGNRLIQGGAKANNGLKGGVKLQLAKGADTLAHAAEVASGRRVLGLLGAVTATEMPANTGDKVIAIGTAATAPTANPTGSVAYILYVDPGTGKLRARSYNGTITDIALP